MKNSNTVNNTSSSKSKKPTNLRFDSTKPTLVLAPLFEFPLRSGDNILVHNRWSSFSRFVPYVDVVGHNVVVRYKNGEMVSQSIYKNSTPNKYTASIKVIFRRTHYLVEKYLSREFQKQAEHHLTNFSYNNIVFCYIWTTKLLYKQKAISSKKAEQRIYIIETINDEVKWYKNIRLASNNPLAKLTAWLSEKWIEDFLSNLPDNLFFIHLTDADYESYKHYLPGHRGIVAPVGANVIVQQTVSGEEVEPSSSAVFQLLFVGSLNVQMNLDALIYFSQNFYPYLHKALGDQLQVTVVGREPSQRVQELCKKMNWGLFANVSNEQLDDFMSQSTFTILPFSYTTGAKLKLLDSVAHGVPFLASTILSHQIESIIYPCLFSDDPAEWLKRIKEVGPGPISRKKSVALKQFAQSYSWDVLTCQLYEFLEAHSK